MASCHRRQPSFFKQKNNKNNTWKLQYIPILNPWFSFLGYFTKTKKNDFLSCIIQKINLNVYKLTTTMSWICSTSSLRFRVPTIPTYPTTAPAPGEFKSRARTFAFVTWVLTFIIATTLPTATLAFPRIWWKAEMFRFWFRTRWGWDEIWKLCCFVCLLGLKKDPMLMVAPKKVSLPVFWCCFRWWYIYIYIYG